MNYKDVVTEGVGYRWYDSKRITPEFAFGYGLSYTTFKYSHLTVNPTRLPLGKEIEIQVDITNMGDRAGEEDVQLYLSTGALVPDRTYLLDLPLEESDRRLKERGNRKDRMELKEAAFHQRVREGFLKLAQKAPERFCVLDATEAPDQVFQRITGDLTKLQHGGSDLK